MSQITVRQANLADTAAITLLYRASVQSWKRRDGGELVESDYDDLTLFERWLNAGPWASVEMCAVHLANLLRGSDGIPLVAEVEGQVGAEAEVFIGREPEPFGHHINISTLAVHPSFDAIGLGSALLTYIQQIGEAIHCKRVTIANAGDEAALFEHHRFARTHTGQRVTFKAQEGRVFYKASELTTFDPHQIDGWHMPLGRYTNAREEWDRMAPGFWNSVPEIVELETKRLHLTVTGQEAYVLMQQDRDAPERVHVFTWTRRPISPLLVMALRDWSAQNNYEELVTFVWDQVLPQIDANIETSDYTQYLYARDL